MFEVGLRLVVLYLSAKTLEWLERSSELLKIGNRKPIETLIR